jgi:hypothetical protein
MSNADRFSETVTFYPVMGIQAARSSSGFGGGWRVYVLAKALDKEGTGNISRELLRDYALSLGVNNRTWQRWITQAREFDLVRDVESVNGEWKLILPNPGVVANSMGCETVGKFKVSMKAADLIGNGWKARIWASYEATYKGKPISRETQQKLVNVPVSTQRYRDAQAGVKRTRNFAKSTMRGDMLPSVIEYTNHKAVFVSKDGFIYWRLPDARSTNLAFVVGKGRARKVNKILHTLQEQNGLLQMQQALSDASMARSVRLFNHTHDQRKATERKLAKAENRIIQDVYEALHLAKSGAQLWLHCPTR